MVSLYATCSVSNNPRRLNVVSCLFRVRFIVSSKLFSALSQKFGDKIPGGLVTKAAAPGYEMVRVGGSQGTAPGFVNANQLNQLSQLAASGYAFPPGLASLAGFNPAAFLQSSKPILVEFLPVRFATSYQDQFKRCLLPFLLLLLSPLPQWKYVEISMHVLFTDESSKLLQ